MGITQLSQSAPSGARAAAARSINIAILAMGGEGGGVLADWIVDLAENSGYLAQTTSVPGVAQRTGSTIYYVELFPEAAVHAAGKEPVLALMRSEEHTSELQSRQYLVCRLLLEKKKKKTTVILSCYISRYNIRRHV